MYGRDSKPAPAPTGVLLFSFRRGEGRRESQLLNKDPFVMRQLADRGTVMYLGACTTEFIRSDPSAVS